VPHKRFYCADKNNEFPHAAIAMYSRLFLELVSKVAVGKGTASAVPPSPQEYRALAPEGLTSDALTNF
jgi:hypothetical protein